MPFTAQELQDAGKIALDFYLKKKPIDQVAVERPLLKALMAKKRSFPGGVLEIVAQGLADRHPIVMNAPEDVRRAAAAAMVSA